MKHGDFTGLAADYARFRAGYAPQVAAAILGYTERRPAGIDAADVGAGTGIWTRTLAALGLHSVVAVDFYLPGCPPPADRIRAVMESLLNGETPRLDKDQRRFG